MKNTFASLTVLLLISCGDSETQHSDEVIAQEVQMGFEIMEESVSGINFKNEIIETDSFNYFNYEYIYLGGGVAAADFNNDGLEDLFFTSNQQENHLYENKGGLRFERIHETSFDYPTNTGWHTGVIIQDINNDGLKDIFVCRSGPRDLDTLRRNLCYINQGNFQFAEKGQELGFKTERPTMHGLFFDMDNDGDLDFYEMNHPYHNKASNLSYSTVVEIENLVKKGSPFSDVLYINENGKFRDVTKEAGVSNHAYGLGVAACDINEDGYTDLYVSNDYMEPDYLYINNQDGTFSQEIKKRTQHVSNYSMGNDVADFNNDGFFDIMTVDMVSEDHVRSKKNMGGMSTEKFWDVVNSGRHYQYMFNALQLNNGDGTFSDIALMAGVAKTDWSWAPLIADFNNDGFKDVFVSNGFKRDTRDNDFLNGYNPKGETVEGFEDVLNLMPSTKVANYMYMNNGDLTFTDVTEKWGVSKPVNSNGAVYSDLDNDGDLDVVLNNMDEHSFIMENRSQGNNYLQFDVSGYPEGTQIKIEFDNSTQILEFRTVRGYLSSTSSILHFGLGQVEKEFEINMKKPGESWKSVVSNSVNQRLKLNELKYNDLSINKLTEKLFKENHKIKHLHQEYVVNDFEKEVLLPNKMSQLGPFMSSGDVDGNGYDDFYIGGSRGFSGTLYLCDGENYTPKSGPWQQQSKREESGSVFFDLENDGDLDLYVCSGSNEYTYDSESMKDQLYLNDGKGNYTNVSDQLPPMQTSSQAVVAGDFDQDGYVDLFVGGRQTPGFYPFAPRSYLLKNNKGVLSDVTAESKALMGPGMITDAQWIDLDNDNDLDLVVVGEWMAPTFYRNDGGLFVDISNNYGTTEEVGWWNCIDTADFNQDGKVDFVFGNLGLNNKFHPEHDHPLEIYTHDFDKNGTYDIVLAKYQDGTCYPVRGKQCSTEQMPFVSQKFPTYGEFAVADLEKIYGKEELENALHYSATNMKSSVLLSSDNGYELKKLPNRVQVAPINDVEVMDVDADGDLDMVVIGNNYAAEVETVRYDAGIGFVLINDGKGVFSVMNPTESGIIVRKDTKDILMVNNLLLISANNDKLTVYQLNRPEN